MRKERNFLRESDLKEEERGIISKKRSLMKIKKRGSRKKTKKNGIRGDLSR